MFAIFTRPYLVINSEFLYLLFAGSDAAHNPAPNAGNDAFDD